MKKNPSTKKYQVHRIVHGYFGNYCAIKCNEHNELLMECEKKLEIFADACTVDLTHQEFLDLFENHLLICKYPKEERRKYITWKTFSKLSDLGMTYSEYREKEAMKKSGIL